MAYDEEMAARIREAVATLTAGTDAVVDEKKMFGGLAFLVNGNMAVAASGQGGTMVRCDPARSDDFIAGEGVELMQMGAGRVMTGWLLVAPEATATDAALALWVGRGVGHALTLPAKQPGKQAAAMRRRTPKAGS